MFLTSSSSLISSLLSSTPYRQITITPARVTQNTMNLAHSEVIVFCIPQFISQTPEDQRSNKHRPALGEGPVGGEETVEGVEHHGDHHHVPEVRGDNV